MSLTLDVLCLSLSTRAMSLTLDVLCLTLYVLCLSHYTWDSTCQVTTLVREVSPLSLHLPRQSIVKEALRKVHLSRGTFASASFPIRVALWLFCGMIRLFCGMIRLFCGTIRLFCRRLGHHTLGACNKASTEATTFGCGSLWGGYDE